MQDFEKLGMFYLGREYDLSVKQSTDAMVLYDAKDLVTHAVCVGMTGSGKTGLCLAIIEEAAIDGIPAIIIDPKGDLANLLLTFPALEPSDFAPWVNHDDARKKGLSPEEFAKQQADLWKTGLAKWGQDGTRIQKLREAADFAVYTPGSSAGIGVSILKSFAAPEPVIREDDELFREHVSITATSLLGLLGVDSDPIQSREHILLSTVFANAWQAETDLDLASLIHQIQSPAVSRIGVIDLESFYPAKERFELAMRLNNLLAAPGFSAWLEGESLDIAQILHTQNGKPRHAIFSIAHLADAERMFFVSLLLNQVLGWMRQQPGTNSLRAIVYMDEIFGFFPPTANPPSKQPLLTLMKQGRAYGLGVMLATQNPVDLDYKGLSNAGTWFVGRLQTDRDKQRLLDGLEGAAAGTSARFDRGQMEETLAGLGNRVFLMNNVHEDAPIVFETRWVMSYLRGPLTRDQIRTLMNERAEASGIADPQGSETTQAEISQRTAAITASETSARPVLPPEFVQRFVPIRTKPTPDATLVYRPEVLGCATVYFSDRKSGVDREEQVCLLAPITQDVVAVDWDSAEAVNPVDRDLDREPAEHASYGELPAAIGKSKSIDRWKKSLVATLYRNQTLQLLYCPSLQETSKAGESERDFRIRLQQRAREVRDAQVEKLRDKYSSKLATLNDRIRRAEQAVEVQREQASHSKWQTAASVGSTLLGAVFGRKTFSVGNIGRASTAMRGASRTYKEKQDVERAQENVAALRQQLVEMEAEFKVESQAIAAACDPLTEMLERVSIKPKKSDISVHSVVLAWVPYWRSEQGETRA